MKSVSIKEIVNSPALQDRFIQVAGVSKADYLKEAGFAIQQANSNPALLRCSKDSIMLSVLQVAELGLTLNPAKDYAYLIPRAGKCCLDPSFTGLVYLATKAGAIKSIKSEVVHANDTIELGEGRSVKRHVPYWFNGHNEPGAIVGVYSEATLPDGSKDWEFMGRGEVEAIRNDSQSWQFAAKNNRTEATIWFKHFGEMARKTVLKRHLKHLKGFSPTQSDILEKAVDLSNADWAKAPSASHVSFVESQVLKAEIDPERKGQLLEDLGEAETVEAVNEIAAEVEGQQHSDHLDAIAAESDLKGGAMSGELLQDCEPIERLEDKSGNGNDAVQENPDKQPISKPFNETAEPLDKSPQQKEELPEDMNEAINAELQITADFGKLSNLSAEGGETAPSNNQ